MEFYQVFRHRVNSSQMRLCGEFVAKLRAGTMLPESVVLRNPGGEEYEVGVVKEGDDEVYFGKGWRMFVEGNGLKSGYVMIFKYDGVMSFDVKVYDYFCCEIERGQDGVEEVSDDADDGPYSEDDSDEEDDDVYEEEEADDESDSDFGVPPEPRVANSSKRGSSGRDHGPRKRQYRRHEWGDSDAELLVKPDNIYFVAGRSSGRRPNQVQVSNIPVRDFGVQLDNKITYVDPRGREYIGKVSKWKTGQAMISGWTAFCQKNNVSYKDKCICELIIGEDRKCSNMLVHIVRKT